jgi:hypothetical protein
LAIVGERILNKFVTQLEQLEKPETPRFDATGLSFDPNKNYQADYASEWRRAFRRQLEENAKSADGLVHDAQENLRLGTILKGLESTITA